jgi:hypothetical protein
MKKTNRKMIPIVILLCSLFLFQPGASGVSTSNKVIPSTGQIIYNNIGTNKATVAYGLYFSESDISFAANHFNLIDTDFDGTRSDFYIRFLSAMQKI